MNSKFTIIFLILALIFGVGFATPAYAQTTEEIRQQLIVLLQQLLALLQEQLGLLLEKRLELTQQDVIITSVMPMIAPPIPATQTDKYKELKNIYLQVTPYQLVKCEDERYERRREYFEGSFSLNIGTEEGKKKAELYPLEGNLALQAIESSYQDCASPHNSKHKTQEQKEAYGELRRYETEI